MQKSKKSTLSCFIIIFTCSIITYISGAILYHTIFIGKTCYEYEFNPIFNHITIPPLFIQINNRDFTLSKVSFYKYRYEENEWSYIPIPRLTISSDNQHLVWARALESREVIFSAKGQAAFSYLNRKTGAYSSCTIPFLLSTFDYKGLIVDLSPVWIDVENNSLYTSTEEFTYRTDPEERNIIYWKLDSRGTSYQNLIAKNTDATRNIHTARQTCLYEEIIYKEGSQQPEALQHLIENIANPVIEHTYQANINGLEEPFFLSSEESLRIYYWVTNCDYTSFGVITNHGTYLFE